jgi:Tfp pilus assembly protein PilF
MSNQNPAYSHSGRIGNFLSTISLILFDSNSAFSVRFLFACQITPSYGIVMPEQKTSKRQLVLISAGLFLLILVAFEPLRHNAFVDYDDNSYIVENSHIRSGLTWPSICWAFTSGYAANWHPLTWLSHMIDIELFGLNPIGHHLHNLLLHIASTILLFWLLHNMTGAVSRSAFVAIVFGIHPLRVESVAWAAERKDVLSMLFFMLTLAAYLYYVKRGGILRYLLVVLCFALGLMAKPMLVTLPIILLVLDWWPLERMRIGTAFSSDRRPPQKSHSFVPWNRLLAEKIPLLLLAMISCVITYIVQQNGGSMTPVKFPIRIFNAITCYMNYLCKTFWPHNLAALYPYPVYVYPLWPPTIALIVLLAITAFTLYRPSQKPYWVVGWLWYTITLLPVLGLVQVGSQTMADRYSYLPSIGITLLVSWALAELCVRRPGCKITLGILGVISIAAMTFSTRTQLTHWKNNLELYEHTIAVTQNNFIMYNNLGTVLLKQGRLPEATEQIMKSLAIRPDYSESLLSMAFIYIANKQVDKAFDCLREILENDPKNTSALFNMGVILEIQNHAEEALRYYEQTVQFDKTHFKAFNRAGILSMQQGRLNKAVEYFRQSLCINPDYTEARRNLQECLQKQKMTPSQ